MVKHDRTLLVIEDDPVLRESLREVVSSYDYAAVSVPDLAGARRVLRHVRVDVVLLDLSLLEGERGETLLDDLAKRPTCPPLVIISGDPVAPTVARHYGVPLVKKPFDIETVLASIDVAVDRDLRPRLDT